MTEPITWRGFELEAKEPYHWEFESDQVYIGLSCDDEEPRPESGWSACLECGDLNSEGVGRWPAEALEAALSELRESLGEHERLVARHFGKPIESRNRKEIFPLLALEWWCRGCQAKRLCHIDGRCQACGSDQTHCVDHLKFEALQRLERKS